MAKTKYFVFWSVICLSQVSMVACASTEGKNTQSAPIYFSDCGVVNLQSTDGRNMTREELIAAEDKALLEALDENSQCNQKALSGGQQAVAAAGSGGAGGAGQGGGQQGSANGLASSQENQTAQQNQQVIRADGGVGGAKSGVEGQEITVCQISRENFAAASTDEDRTFWQGEVDKNCN